MAGTSKSEFEKMLKGKTDEIQRNAANAKKCTKKSGKKAKWSVVLFLVCALVCGYAFLNPEGYENMFSGGLSNKERLPNVPWEFYDHKLLESRLEGNNKRMTGDIPITVIISSSSDHPWEADDLAKAKQAVYDGISIMESAATKYGAILNMTPHFIEVKNNEGFPVGCASKEVVSWINSTVEKAGLGSSGGSATRALRSRYDSDQAPIVFMPNEIDRSYATNPIIEFAVCYRLSDGRTFAHEVAHLFGAKDYYYPNELANLAESYYPNSIMCSAETEFDNLTAYLVGFTDNLPSDALEFLQKSEYFDYSGAATSRPITESTTTPGTSSGSISWSNGTYTGETKDGWPHGTGTLVREIETNGKQAKYVGEWVEGEMEGYGTFYYADGSIYAGYWKNGKQNGQGTYTDTNGKTYSGTWKDGKAQ